MSKDIIITSFAIFFVSFVIATCYLAYWVSRQDQEIEELRGQIICNTKLESFIATTTEPLTQEDNL